MSFDRYELMERRIREILLEDAPAGVPERLRSLIAEVPELGVGGRPGLVRGWIWLGRAGAFLAAGVAMMALVTLVAIPLLPRSAGERLGGVAIVQPSIGLDYPTDDPTSQLVATGHVVDSGGQPVAGVVLFVDLYQTPPQSTQCSVAPCQLLPVEAVVSATDGSFSVHLRPNAAILAAASANGGIADFMFGPRISGFQFTMGDFSLQVQGDRFIALPDPITIVIDTLHPHPPITAPPYPVPSPSERSAQPT